MTAATPYSPMPQDWKPQTTQELVRGKLVRVWRWKGHELAFRGFDADTPAWDAFRRECWALKALLEGGAPHVSYAHRDRHNVAMRRAEHMPRNGAPCLPAQEESIRTAAERVEVLGRDT